MTRFLLRSLSLAVFSFAVLSPLQVQAQSFQRLGALALGDVSETGIRSAVIDTDNGYAYFGISTPLGVKGKVLKIRLSDFSRVDTLILDEGIPASAVIDAAGGFAYFGTNTSPGKIVKIRLSDFSRVGVLTLDAGEDNLTSAVIDPAGGFAYFGTKTSPGKIVKIKLSDFTREAFLALNTGENFLSSAVIDPAGGFAYFGSLTGGVSNPGSGVVKIRLSDFSRAGAFPLEAGQFGITSAIIDPAGGFAYFATYADNGFGVNITGIVLKIRLSDFTEAGRLFFALKEGPLDSAVIDPAGGFAYFGMDTGLGTVISGVKVEKIRLSDLSRVDTLTLETNDEFDVSAVIDPAGGFAYFGFADAGENTNPVKIGKIRLSDFSQTDTLTLLKADSLLISAAVDEAGGFAYFGTAESPAKVLKIDLGNLTLKDTLTLNPGENILTSAVIDRVRGFAYFGTSDLDNLGLGSISTHSYIVKIRLSDFTRVGAITISSTTLVGSLTTAVIDEPGGFAYFGSRNSKVLKVDLQNFSVAKTIFMATNQSLLSSAIDLRKGFAFFSSHGGKVYVADLGDHLGLGLSFYKLEKAPLVAKLLATGLYDRVSVVMEDQINLLTSQNITSAVIDPDGGYAYFGGSKKCTSLQPTNPIQFGTSCDTGAESSVSLVDIDFNLSVVATVVKKPEALVGDEAAQQDILIPVPGFKPLSKTNVGSDSLLSGFIDKPRGRAYFGGSQFNFLGESGSVAQVDTNPSSFVLISSSTLNPSFSCADFSCSNHAEAEGVLSSVAFDPTNGVAYFGTGASPSRIVKVKIFSPFIGIPPPNLAAEALGVSSLKWTFSGLSSAESYNFYPSTGGPPIVLSTSATQLIQVGLSTNTAYSASISAVNSSGEGPRSALVTRYTLSAPATSFALLSTNLNSARVSWAANENPSYTVYEVGWWIAGGSTNSATTQETSALLRGLTVDTTVYMSVRAVNGNGIPTSYDVERSTKITGIAVETATPVAEKTVTFQEASRELRVRVPAGAFREAVQVAVGVPAAQSIPPPTGNLRALSRKVALEVLLDKDVQPSRDVEISLGYEDADVAGLDPDKLVVARYDENHSLWVPLYSTRDKTAKRVSAGTSHLSLFQIMQSDPSSGALSGVTVGPNPYRPRKNPGQVMTFRNLPAGAKIKIYTYLGELVREVLEDGTGNAAWDGKNDSGKEAASGVYVGLIKASSATRTLHLAVER